MSSLSTDNPRFGILDLDEDRLSASLGAGVEVPLNSLLGLRFEARGYWIDMPREGITSGDLVQTEVATGLSFRW